MPLEALARCNFKIKSPNTQNFLLQKLQIFSDDGEAVPALILELILLLNEFLILFLIGETSAKETGIKDSVTNNVSITFKKKFFSMCINLI